MKIIYHTLIAALFALCSCSNTPSGAVLIEAESFAEKGGWVIDQQFMDLMGSPYLMAHGYGIPVENASTVVNIPHSGHYTVYVRTYNWTSPWSEKEGAGHFALKIADQPLSTTLGATGDCWEWQKAGAVDLKAGETQIALEDLTGFNGRCDAIYLSLDGKAPTNDPKELEALRLKMLNVKPQSAGEFDLVVIGGGVAGMSAAAAAARQGMKVALINDRPILGGCNSSEVRVHLGGRVNMAPYTNLGNLLREFGHTRIGNAKPEDYYEDQKKQDFIDGEQNITLFPSTRAFEVEMKGSQITSIKTKHIETGEELIFKAPLFSDCTGDGTIGYLAGADFHMGREGRSEFNEALAPIEPDKMTMGASVQWYSVDHDTPQSFPEFDYSLGFNEQSYERVTMGEWTWETGMNYDQITDFERIRDYGMAVIFSNWSYIKNHSTVQEQYTNKALDWVAYVAGKRESRRLLGDLILTGNDVIDGVEYEDGSATTTWSIDLHYPDPNNTKNFPGAEFKSIAQHNVVAPYPVPYRCLYSRNIDNLFMAGRNISVTHVALGTVRVMRTTSMLGEVVGLAASLCHKHKSQPRSVYTQYLEELKLLMEKGAGKEDAPDTQNFNLGS